MRNYNTSNIIRPINILKDYTAINNSGNFLIDGGNQNTISGDVLELTSDSEKSLDFTLINNLKSKIKNIEKIDASIDTNIQRIKLGYQDIIDITDGRDKLIIKLGNRDTLDWDPADFAAQGFTKNTDTNGGSFGTDNIGGTDYEVWTDGEVTLYIEAEAGAMINGVSV